VSRAFNQAAGVYSLSEPDVFTQLVSLREPDGSNDSDVRDLVRDCTKIMCARTPGRATWVLKFRSFGIELGDLFYHLFPESKVVFLYRNAEGYIRSLARAVRLFEPETQQALPAIQQVFSRLAPVLRAYTATHTTTIPPIELPVVLWVSVMQRCIALQQHGVPMVCARYEELKQAPRAMLAAIFAYCDVSVPDPTALDTVLAQDSQAGTTFSQLQAEQASSRLTDAQVRDVNRLLQHYAPRFTSDVMLPHTFVPGRS
jgi:hypothetical protein